ncbi:tripartite tricarboxylate transporter TctB family protein [Nocardioides sp. NPDC047086]|uniref:tripartite tricarboxylate transporter TctB family protein n=1 Tax=Nocardioides sp. NPDC047086 TaxID=3154810 RepID=UPI0033D40293
MSERTDGAVSAHDAPDPDQRLGMDQRRTALATLILGGLMVAFGVVVLIQAILLDNDAHVVGPATMPWVVAVLLLVIGGALGLSARPDLRAWRQAPQTSPQDWRRAAVLLAVLLVFAVVVTHLGYVVSATLLFGTVAVVLGAPARFRAYVYGWSVSVVVFLAFDVLIGIALPAGPWGF